MVVERKGMVPWTIFVEPKVKAKLVAIIEKEYENISRGMHQVCMEYIKSRKRRTLRPEIND